MSYAIDHLDALNTLRRDGVAMHLTLRGGVTEALDGQQTVAADVTVRGYGMPYPISVTEFERFRTSVLVVTEAPRVLWVPEVYGAKPLLNAEAVLSDVLYHVRDIQPFAPGGLMVFAYLILGR